jgi:putative multiple sugar transport system permease protein
MTDIATTAERPSIMSFVKANIRDYALLLSLAAIMVFFQFTTKGILFTPLNMTNIILQNSYIVIMALGMLLIIVAGHIDLSVGFLSGFVGAIAGVLMVTNPFWPVEWKLGTVPAIAVCLLAGTLIGALQGWFVARFRIPAFIVTLAGMLIFRGLMIAMLSGRNLGPFPESFQAISNGYVPDLLAFMAPAGINMFALVVGAVVTLLILWSNWKARMLEQAHGMAEEPIELFYGRNALIAAAFLAFSWIMANHRGLPNVLITMFALVALFMFITTRTTFGRRVYAMGGNEKAARLSGLNTEKITIAIFAIMGALSALAGPCLCSPPQFGPAQGRCRARTGRDRRLLHRRGGGHGRRGQDHGGGDRGLHHGCHEQRHGHHGHRHRLAAGHQGGRASACRVPGRLFQEQVVEARFLHLRIAGAGAGPGGRQLH